MEANSIFHGYITEINTAMTKTSGNISTNIPMLTHLTLMHYELYFLHVAQSLPYDRQSSNVTFTVTTTLYIQGRVTGMSFIRGGCF